MDLRSPASNIHQLVTLPESRWPLFASGAGVGPALLYWGELVVFVGVAWLLGGWARSPLRFFEWLLLGVGLSTQSWFVFSLTAVWLIVMRWRSDWRPAETMPAVRFNAVQVLLALFTVIAICDAGVLGNPQRIAVAPGHGSCRRRFLRQPVQLVPGSDRGAARSAEHLQRADVGVPRAVLRVGELDGVRAGALAALGVRSVEVRRPVEIGW